MMRRIGFVFLTLLSLVALGGCKSAPPPRPPGVQRVFTGTLETSESISLSSSANVRIMLLEISKPGEPPRILVTNQMTTRGRQFPLPFELPVDVSLIKPGGAYAIAASVAVGGQLRYMAVPPTVIDATQASDAIRVKLSPPPAMR